MKVDKDCGQGTNGGTRHVYAATQAEAERQRAWRREAYFRRAFSGGRSLFARVADGVGLRLIVLGAAYLAFAPRFSSRLTALLLATITLGIASLVMRIAREILFERFVTREKKRIARMLLSDRLLLADMQTVAGLAGALCPQNERTVVLQRAMPVNADALLALVRARRACGKLHVFTCTSFDRSAEAFAARSNGRLVLHGSDELISAALDAGMEPSQREIFDYIEAESCVARKRRHAASDHRSPFVFGSVKKYLLVALLLGGASFLTRYPLYYRMLAGLCMTIAAIGATFMRAPRTHRSVHDIG